MRASPKNQGTFLVYKKNREASLPASCLSTMLLTLVSGNK